MSKKVSALTAVVNRIVVLNSLVNTAITTTADLLFLVKELLPKCSAPECDGCAVGSYDGKLLCYRCCLSCEAKDQKVAWNPNRRVIQRLESSVSSLRDNGYLDAEDMN